MFFQTNLTDGGGVQLFLRLALLCAAFALALAGCASDGSDESAGSTTSTAGEAENSSPKMPQNCYGMVGDDVFLSQNELETAIGNASGTMTLQLGPLVENTYLKTISNAIKTSPNLSSVRLDLSNATSVTSIGDNAFNNCTKLASVTIPSSVTSIGNNAFNSCTALASVTIPSSVTSIGRFAFYHCAELASVTIPSSVTSIGGYAFSGCLELKSATISSSVIGNDAFNSCTKLASVTIPSSVTSIGNHAFYSCTSLTSVTFENPNGWYISDDATLDAGEINEESIDVNDAGTAARLLTDGSLGNNYLLRKP